MLSIFHLFSKSKNRVLFLGIFFFILSFPFVGKGQTITLFEHPDTAASTYLSARSPIEFNGNLYLFYEQDYGNQNFLAKFNGSSLIPIPNPDNHRLERTFVFNNNLYTLSWYTTFSPYRLKSRLVKITDSTSTIIPNPNDESLILNTSFTVYHNELYFFYQEGNSAKLAKFDGNTITIIPNQNSNFGYLNQTMIVFNDKLYFHSRAQYDVNVLSEFDGTSVKYYANPAAGQGIYSNPIIFKNNLYYNFSHINGNIQIAKFDGTNLSLIPNPSFIQYSYVNDAIEYKGNLYVKYYNDFKVKFLKFDGLSFTEIQFPLSGQMAINDQKLIEYKNELYFNFQDSLEHNHLAKCDGNTINIISTPSGGEISFYTSVKFNNSLFFVFKKLSSEVYHIAKFNGDSINLLDNLSTGYGPTKNNFTIFNNKLYFYYRYERLDSEEGFIDKIKFAQYEEILNPTAYSVTGGGSYCSGDDGLEIGLSRSDLSVNYQLKKNNINEGSPINGNGGAISFGKKTSIGTYTVEATSVINGRTSIMEGSASVEISSQCLSASISGSNTICAGTSTNLSITIIGNTSSFTVTYSNGADTITIPNYVSNTPISVNPLNTTTYTLVSVTDANNVVGNVSGSAVVTVDETIAAFNLYFTPSDIIINCSDAMPAIPNIIATSSCATVTMDVVSTKSNDPKQCAYYSYTVTRTWAATDKRGNTATVSQVITVQDNSAPIITPLASITVTEAFIPTSITTTDCMALPTVTFTDIKITNTPPPCKNYAYTLSRIWKVTDACGNSSTATQTIKAQGIILTCPSDKTIYTNSDGIANYNCSSLATATMGLAPTFTDGCDAAVLRYAIAGATTGTGNGSVAGVNFAKGVSKITYSLVSNASDECSFNITVKDNEGPKIILTPTVVLDACTMPNPIPNTFKPSVSDNCFGTNTLEVMNDVLADQTGCATKVAAQKYTKLLTRTWKATDENGNTATAVQKIYLRDMTPPITVCKNVTVNIGSTNVSYPVSSLNNGSNDNCTAANALTFVGCMNTGAIACTNFGANLTLKASMIPAGQNQATIPVLVKAKDACGNETATPVSTIVTLKRIGTMNNITNGNDNSMAIQDTESNIPAETSSTPNVHGEMKCYPTPFSEDLNIQYNLTEAIENVTLKVYDNQGRLVKTMEQAEQLAGFYQIRWNLSDLQAGMYHVCLELNGKCTKMERVIMMK